VEGTVHKKYDKTDCSNYRGMSLLLASHKILSNILLSRLNSYIGEIIVDRECGFRCSRSTTDHFFSVHQLLDKNGSTVRQYIRYASASRKPKIHFGEKYCTMLS
jgi:hypothetical protein